MIPAEDYAAMWEADLSMQDMLRDRNLQTHRRLLGVSDINHCRNYAALFLSGQPFTDAPDIGPAMAGTFYHKGALAEIGEARPSALVEQEVNVTLTNGFQLLGHADLIEPDEPSVTDVKTVADDMPAVRRNGANAQQRSQRHLYAAGAVQGGLVPAEGLVTRNLWVNRSGRKDAPHVEQEPYSPGVLDDAARWVDDVMHHVETETPASRDKDVFFCRQFCPFFTACRGEFEVEEVVHSPELAEAADLYAEGLRQEKEGAALKKAAAETLARVEGQRVVVEGPDGKRRQLASTWVKASDVNYTRAGYYRLGVGEAS